MMSQYHSLIELYLTRIREFYRQPARMFWVYGFPTIMAFGLSLATQGRGKEAVEVDVVANPAAKSLLAALDRPEVRAGRPGRAGLTFRQDTAEEAEKRLKTGKAALVVVPAPLGPFASPGSSGTNSTSTPPPVVYRYDPTRPEAAAARAAFDDALQRARGRTDPVATGEQLVTEPGSRYIDFLIPGLIGLNTMGGGLWGIGFLLVNFRIGKLLKRFMATPMPRRNFLLALLGARLTFLLPDVSVLLLLGHFAFGMPIRGNLITIVLVDAMGALAFAGIGLLIASRAQSTETVSGLMNLVMLPMWLLSGVFFSAERFPPVMQPIVQALPLTQLVNALRMVILEGAGLIAIAPALAILAAWTVGTFLLALKLFRWT